MILFWAGRRVRVALAPDRDLVGGAADTHRVRLRHNQTRVTTLKTPETQTHIAHFFRHPRSLSAG